MANPQKEHGHLRLATELVLVFCIYRLSGQEWQILWVILRKTWGWNKKKDTISLSQISLLTNITRPNVVRIVSKLQKKRVIKKDNSLYLNSYSFNKNYEEWEGLSTILSTMAVDNSKSVIKKNQDVIKKENKSVDQMVTYNKQYNHYTITKNIKNIKTNNNIINNKGINEYTQRWSNVPVEFKDLIAKLSKKGVLKG